MVVNEEKASQTVGSDTGAEPARTPAAEEAAASNSSAGTEDVIRGEWLVWRAVVGLLGVQRSFPVAR